MISDDPGVIDALSVPASATISEAMQAIGRGQLGLALLVEPGTGRFAGLVTDGDIRRALLAGLGLQSPVAAVPRPEPRTARFGMPAEQVAALFSVPVRVVPLLDEDNRVVDLAVFDRRARLPVAEPSLSGNELLYVSECVLTGWISSAGAFVGKFERMFAEFCGVRYAVATSNGTTALHLTLLALDIGAGDEVIVPSLTFIATANAVAYVGAQPVLVDSEPETWNMDPARIEEAITPRTRAILAVHLYGHPADMGAIMEIAARHGLAVIEDAAEAHGARFQGRVVGGIGDLGAFSFYGNKIVTTGEGGMVVTNRPELAEKVRVLRDHGMSAERRYWHPVLGFNYRMTNLQAAIGVAQMEKIESILAAKARVSRCYDENLRGIPGLTLPPRVTWAENVFWLYTVLIDFGVLGVTREAVQEALQIDGVETRPVFVPIHRQPLYDRGECLPVAERLSSLGLSLPSSPSMSEAEVRRVADSLQRALRGRS
jgi:perosamine synthetase